VSAIRVDNFKSHCRCKVKSFNFTVDAKNNHYNNCYEKQYNSDNDKHGISSNKNNVKNLQAM